MIDTRTSAPAPLLLAALGGAALGALALALTTPRIRKAFQARLRNLGSRFRTRVAEDLDDGEVLAMFI